MRAVNAELRYIQLSESMATDVTLGVAKGFDAAGAKGNLDQLRVFLGACPDLISSAST